MDMFEKNVKALASYNIVLAQELMNLEGKELSYELVLGQDPVNINLFEKDGYKPLYEGVPIDQTIEKYNRFNKYKRYPFLYFFGFGNGVFYRMLLENKTIEKIVVFEPNLEILFVIFHLIDFSKDLETERLSILSTDQINYEILATLFGHKAKTYVRVYDLHVINEYYEQKYHDLILEVNRRCLDTIHHLIVSLGNDIKDNLLGLKHFLKNIPYQIQTPPVSELFKKTKVSKCAVLAATGPSLQKQLPLLKQIQDFVTILCVDASFPILTQYGIKPDVVLSIERVEPTGSFYERVMKQYGSKAFEDVVFALTSIVHDKTLNYTLRHKDLPQSATVQLSNRPLKYLDTFGLKEWGYLGAGMSAANMAFELAYLSGFDAVIVIGQDLAYGKDGSSHSRGNIWGQDQIASKKHDLMVCAYGGDGMVKTTQVWQMFLSFYERDVEEYKSFRPNYRMINATCGGARILGMEEMNFEEAVLECVDFESKKGKIELKPSSQELREKSTATIKANFDLFYQSGKEVKEAAQKLFLKIADQCNEFEKLHKENRLDDIDFDEVAKIIEEIDEVKELTAQDPFNRFFMDLVSSFIAHQELELAKVQVANSETQEEKKAKMVEWVYAHRYWLFSLAGGIEAILMQFDEAKDAIEAM